MMRDDALDEMRRQVQQSLIAAKKQQLGEEYGMLMAGADSELPPEVELEWLTFIEQFERQFAENKQITVRERLGPPEPPGADTVTASEAADAVQTLLKRLAAGHVTVDFLGDWDDREAYRFLTEELLDYEIDAIWIDGLMQCFIATTPAYDVEASVEFFVRAVFERDLRVLLAASTHQSLYDGRGAPLDATTYEALLKAVWQRPPCERFGRVEAVAGEIAEEEAEVTAVVTWREAGQFRSVESRFRLRPCPYADWDVVQTTFLDDLLAL